MPENPGHPECSCRSLGQLPNRVTGFDRLRLPQQLLPPMKLPIHNRTHGGMPPHYPHSHAVRKPERATSFTLLSCPISSLNCAQQCGEEQDGLCIALTIQRGFQVPNLKFETKRGLLLGLRCHVSRSVQKPKLLSNENGPRRQCRPQFHGCMQVAVIAQHLPGWEKSPSLVYAHFRGRRLGLTPRRVCSDHS